MLVKVMSTTRARNVLVYYVDADCGAEHARAYGVLVASTMSAKDGRTRVWHDNNHGRTETHLLDALKYEALPLTDP